MNSQSIDVVGSAAASSLAMLLSSPGIVLILITGIGIGIIAAQLFAIFLNYKKIAVLLDKEHIKQAISEVIQPVLSSIGESINDMAAATRSQTEAMQERAKDDADLIRKIADRHV